jgi:TRAP-type uncharacterized transport system fused permease subunit
MADDPSTGTRFRSLAGPARTAERSLLLGLTLCGAAWAGELHIFLNLTFFKEQFLGLFFALGIAAVFLRVKGRINEPDNRVPWRDWLFSVGSLLTGGYIVVMYPSIAYHLGILAPERWLLGGLAVILILEATRRVVGWTLVFLALACILYARSAYLFPGLLYAKGSSWERIASYLYLDSSGILGIPLSVAASVVAMPVPTMPSAGKPRLPNISTQLAKALKTTATTMMASAQPGRSSAETKERSTM